VIRPTSNRVLVRIEPQIQSTVLHIPEVAGEDARWGTVVAVGPKVKDVKQGSRVYFVPQRSFNEFVIGGVRHKLFHEQNLEAMTE